MQSTVSNIGQGEYRTKVSGPYYKLDLYNNAGDVVLSQWLEQPPHPQNPGLNPALLAAAIAAHRPELTPDFTRVRRLEVLDGAGGVFW